MAITTRERRSTRFAASDAAAGGGAGVVSSKPQQHPNNNNKSLPSWASVTAPKEGVGANDDKVIVGEDPLPMEDEEAYLRTRSYHCTSRQMDRTWYETLYSVGGKLIQDELDIILSQHSAGGNSITISTADTKNGEKNTSDALDSIEGQANQRVDDKAGNGNKSGVDDVAASDTNTLSSILSQYKSLQTQDIRQYNPLLLPIIQVRGPCHSLDRYEWMKNITLTTKRRRPRTCVVWIQQVSRSSTCMMGVTASNNTITYQEEVVRQCILQETLLTLQRSRRLSSTSSLTDVLMEWASDSIAFDSILVCMETPACTSHDVHVFIEWLAERRAYDGIPISLLWMVPPSASAVSNANGSELGLPSPTSWGPVGALLRPVVLPTTSQLLDAWWDRISTKLLFLMGLSSRRRQRQIFDETIGRAYCEEHFSAVHAVRSLKQVIAHLHLQPGYFLVTSAAASSGMDEVSRGTKTNIEGNSNIRHTDMFLRENHDRLKWFRLDPYAREVLQRQRKNGETSAISRKELELHEKDMEASFRKIACIALPLKREMLQNASLQEKDNFHVPSIFNLLAVDPLSTSTGSVRLCSQVAPSLMPLLFRMRDEYPSKYDDFSDTSDGSGNRHEIRASINKLIIVLGHATHMEDFDACLADMTDSELRRLLVSASEPLLFDCERDALSSLTAQPRRQTVTGLVMDIDNGIETVADGAGSRHLSISNNLAGCLYRLILDDYVSIRRSEWFVLFRQTYASHLPLHNACTLFSCGIGSLKIAGLIREKQVKKDIMYTKTALVWCSID